MRYVYGFGDDVPGGRELLGGKGQGLAEMTRLGLPVPGGFTITTDACRAYLRDGALPPELMDQVSEHLASLEAEVAKRFGNDRDPLLVSVRSGAAVSMPGMMDTILNLGLNDRSVEGLAASTGDRRFARDSYRRLIQMFGEVVMNAPSESFENALRSYKAKSRVKSDSDLSADDLAVLIDLFKRTCKLGSDGEFPSEPHEQLRRAIIAVFESWRNPRAEVYRRTYGISEQMGTAVSVVQMVFGNRGDTSATGVAFTRNPATGEAGLYGEFLLNAQGEDVVAGIRTPRPLADMQRVLPDPFDDLLDILASLEQHYRDVQDVEFTIQEGHPTSSRHGRRSEPPSRHCDAPSTWRMRR